MCLLKILFREFMFALVFSMPLIFTLLANSISHFFMFLGLLFSNNMKHEVKTLKMRSWRGICLLQYLPSLRYGSKGTSNNRK